MKFREWLGTHVVEIGVGAATAVGLGVGLYYGINIGKGLKEQEWKERLPLILNKVAGISSACTGEAIRRYVPDAERLISDYAENYGPIDVPQIFYHEPSIKELYKYCGIELKD